MGLQRVAAEQQSGIQREPAAKQNPESDFVTILQSGSTNTRPYKVVIHKDGSATVEIGGGNTAFAGQPPQTKEFPAGTIATKPLQQLLGEIGDVSAIPIGMCAKSVSFGTRTQVVYEGKTSGDLQCVSKSASGSGQPLRASQQLGEAVLAILGQLRITAPRVLRNP